MLRELTTGLHDLADALRSLKLPDHVEHVHTVHWIPPPGWLLLGMVLGVLVVWVVKWK